MARKPKAIKESKDGLFTLTLILADKTYIEKADSILEAINAISPDPIKTRGIFTVTDGKMTAERTFYVAQLKKLLANKTAKEIFAKRMGDAIGVPRVI